MSQGCGRGQCARLAAYAVVRRRIPVPQPQGLAYFGSSWRCERTQRNHRKEHKTPAIGAGNGVVTHINVFTVPAGKQQALVDSLIETVGAARVVPGWMSASVHRSYDGTQVVNYVQFEDHSAAQAVLRHLGSGGFLERNTSLGSVAPGQYEVVYTLSSTAGA